MAKAIDRDGTFRGIYQHNQTDLEFVRAVDDDGPATLLSLRPEAGPEALRAWDGDYGFDGVGVVGDWNGDGNDTVGLQGDYDLDGDVDGADYV